MAQVEIRLLQRDLTTVLRALARVRIIHLHRMEVAGAEKGRGETLGWGLLSREAAGTVRVG
jgi:hypothetical protein